MVKSLAFHAGVTGSNPVGVTNKNENSVCNSVGQSARLIPKWSGVQVPPHGHVSKVIAMEIAIVNRL